MSLLPDGFAALEPFVAGWAIAGSNARDQRRTLASADERQAFFTAMRPLLPEALARLDRTPLASHDAAEHRLMLLALAFAHVAPAQDILGDDEPAHACNRRRLPITRATADEPA